MHKNYLNNFTVIQIIFLICLTGIIGLGFNPHPKANNTSFLKHKKGLEEPNANYEIDAYNGQTITVCSGNFFDSGGGSGSYLNNENYSITFCSSTGGAIEIAFQSFDVEYHSSCSYDKLRVYDGSSSSATLLGTYCGTSSPGTFTSSGTCLHFRFTTDGSVTSTGWNASISCSTPSLEVNTNSISNATCTSTDGSIDVSVSGGTTPYSYFWSNGAFSQDLNNIAAGTYTLTVMDNGGLQEVNSFIVGSTSPVTLTTSVTNANCPSTNGSVNLTVNNATAPITYNWSNGATTQDLSSIGSGFYEVTVTDGNGCIATAYALVGCGTEICDNNLDDDGDGLVDEYDSDCPCADTEFFFGDCTPSCEYIPPPGSSGFDLTSQWTSSVGVTNISQLFVGDMDGEADGVPEIITMRGLSYNVSATNAIYLLDGNDGSLKYHPNTLRMNSRNKGLAVGDADRDGRAEFYYMTADDETTGNSRKIACYEYNPNGTNPAGSGTGTFTLQWTSNTQVTCGLSGSELFAVEDFTVGLADFNYDGTPEVYVGNEIYNAITGQRIATGGTNAIGSWNHGEFASAFHVMAVTVAVDVLPDAACADCSGLELVAGNQVYSVNISGGTMTVRRQAPNSLPDGNTAIADYDLDGDLDAVITTNNASSSFLYIWDLQTNTQIGNTHTVKTTSTLFYHPINLPVIADFDGDNRPEIGVCGNLIFQVVEDHTVNIAGTGGVLWSLTTSDNSGQTGASVFDFNGDGVSEVVYRDESNLRIMAGPNGTNLATFSCGSGTGGEYSVVADIDNDGETEIVCNCSNSPGSSNAIANTQAFKSDQFPWVSTRKVWNQYAYFNVNIDDDMTIPAQQQAQHLVGSPSSGVSGPLNTFLKQVSPLDKSGNRIFPAADLTATITVDAAQCISNGTVDLNITITNNGLEDVPSNLPIAIYSSDPESFNATLMTTVNTSNGVMQGNFIVENHTLNVSSLTFPTTIYVVINDDGTESRPYDLATDFPVTSVAECDFTNNKSAVLLSQGCLPFEICDNGIDDNGNGLIDCADADCKPVISNVALTQPTCSNPTGGQIIITATGSGTLAYSILNETTWQSSNTFSNLGMGQYIIRVRNNYGCETEYTNNPIVFDFGSCPEICNDGIDNDGDGLIDCDDPDCDGVGDATNVGNQ
jgi:hypothetical protein